MNIYRFVLLLTERLSMPLRWLPPTLARIALGWVFVVTGWGKLHNLEQVTQFFTDLGIPFPQYQAPFVAGTELVCGALLLLGLLTRAAAVPLICTMIVAIATAQIGEVETLSDLLGLVETLYIVLFAWLAIAGPGPLSIDALGRRAVMKRQSVDERGTSCRLTMEEMSMNSNAKKALLAAAVAGLVMTQHAVAADGGKTAEQAKVKCYGVNACKGQGGCGGAGHGCAGKNACKGQGFIETTPEDCKAKGGKQG